MQWVEEYTCNVLSVVPGLPDGLAAAWKQPPLTFSQHGRQGGTWQTKNAPLQREMCELNTRLSDVVKPEMLPMQAPARMP